MVDLSSVHIGDVLVVRNDILHVDGVVSSMAEYCGRIVTVRKTYDESLDAISIEEDGGMFYWFNECFDIYDEPGELQSLNVEMLFDEVV